MIFVVLGSKQNDMQAYDLKLRAIEAWKSLLPHRHLRLSGNLANLVDGRRDDKQGDSTSGQRTWQDLSTHR